MNKIVLDNTYLTSLTALTLIFAGCGQIPTGKTPGSLADRQRVWDLRSWLDQFAQADEFSGVVLLAKDNHVLFERAYGFADRATRTPNKVDTQFYLASVTKVFTAVAILKLAQAGKFSLDDKLVQVLPTYLNHQVANKVTLRQLLTHTSGLGNYFGKFAQANFRLYPTPESFLPLFAGDPLEFEPGTKSSYSNAGYLILGLIIARVSGRSYEDFVQEQVFKPAGMAHSDWITGETRGLNCIGGARSTVGDLFRFSLALQRHQLLNKDYTELELSGGAGMQAEIVNGIGVTGHIGGAPGMSTSFDIYPQLGYTAVVLSTTDGAAITVRDKIRLMNADFRMQNSE